MRANVANIMHRTEIMEGKNKMRVLRVSGKRIWRRYKRQRRYKNLGFAGHGNEIEQKSSKVSTEVTV